MIKKIAWFACLALLAPFFLFSQSNGAQPPLEPYLAAAPEIVSHAAVLLDAETGTVLYAKNPHEEIPPASLAKLMTMHLVMKEVGSGRASFDEIVPVKTESWALRQPPRSSLMFLAPGQIVTLGEIMLGLAVSSGNDAAVAAALRLASSVADFALMMTMEARRLGLSRTRFTEPAGISEDNMTTAGEFALFCREYLRQHPRSLAEFHSVREFAYPKAANVAEAFRGDPKTIAQENRNNLLKTFPGVDGLKTGYIDEAGYNIALTAERDGTRFIAVILGAPAHPGGDRVRDRDGERLLSWAFATFKTVRPAAQTPEPARLWKGRDKRASLRLEEDPVFTAPLNRAASLQYAEEIMHPLIAPLPAHYPAGALVIFDEEGELHRVRLLTARAYEQGNILKRVWDSLRLLFMKRTP
ncbi:MAG: D-alanyl-D-alanine carboxypeptidase [Treponema sp.]|jgi:D-alanyl-D-alanine carboxypeptidase (penicillin-binding protein 5/6)|nr:D-alanyl-D-alanine carboxypeptidase [Treponema sp.]